MKGFQFGEPKGDTRFPMGRCCDWYIEISKQRMGKANTPMPVLSSCWKLHCACFTFHALYHRGTLAEPQEHAQDTLKTPALIIAPYEANEKLLDRKPTALPNWKSCTIRNARAEYKVETGGSMESSVCAAAQLTQIQGRAHRDAGKTGPLPSVTRTAPGQQRRFTC
jgi:hypothetical protein